MVLAAFVSVVPTVVSALVWSTKRPTYPGFGRWTLKSLRHARHFTILGLGDRAGLDHRGAGKSVGSRRRHP